MKGSKGTSGGQLIHQAGTSTSQLHLQNHPQLHQHYEEMKHELQADGHHEIILSSIINLPDYSQFLNKNENSL